MTRLVVSRLLAVVPLLFFVSSATFMLSQLSTIDPAEIRAGANASQEQVDAIRTQMGLDRPVAEQYWDWLTGAVRGDLGNSLYTGASVTQSIKQAMPVTLSLTFGALIVAALIGVPTGIFSALRAGKASDRFLSLFATIGQAMPSFWLAQLLIFFVALRLGWLPATGFVGPTADLAGWLRSIILPSVSLGVIAAAAISRQTRSSMIGVLQQEYVRTALSKGLSKRRVVFKHALKNASIPVVTVMSFQVASLLGGSIVVERLFALRGLGSIAIDAVVRRDPDVIQGVVVVTVVIVVLVNLLLDVTYAWLNPKVRPS